jgi:hypothetical protein
VTARQRNARKWYPKDGKMTECSKAMKYTKDINVHRCSYRNKRSLKI